MLTWGFDTGTYTFSWKTVFMFWSVFCTLYSPMSSIFSPEREKSPVLLSQSSLPL
uniref:Uncharacterized protein n=1 Tax=Anguilla anguilla TaxID=7936 RepID=A0A0E9U4Q7_ANGAN